MRRRIKKIFLKTKSSPCIDKTLRDIISLQEQKYIDKYGMTMDELYSSGAIKHLALGLVCHKVREYLEFIFSDPSDAHRIVAYFLQLGAKPTSYYMITKYTGVCCENIPAIMFKLVKYKVLTRKRFGNKFFACTVVK